MLKPYTYKRLDISKALKGILGVMKLSDFVVAHLPIHDSTAIHRILSILKHLSKIMYICFPLVKSDHYSIAV